MSDFPQIDSSDNVHYLPPNRGGPPNPPGGDLEARVSRLEDDVSAIKLTLARIDERLSVVIPNLPTKADLLETERRVSDKVAAVDTRVGVTEGELRRSLGVWQFLGIMIVAVGFIVKWPAISAAFGL